MRLHLRTTGRRKTWTLEQEVGRKQKIIGTMAWLHANYVHPWRLHTCIFSYLRGLLRKRVNLNMPQNTPFCFWANRPLLSETILHMDFWGHHPRYWSEALVASNAWEAIKEHAIIGSVAQEQGKKQVPIPIQHLPINCCRSDTASLSVLKQLGWS